MPSIIQAGSSSDPGIVTSGDSDGILQLRTGPIGAKVNAITADASGNVTVYGALRTTLQPSMIRMTGSNGYGSSSFYTRRFTTLVTNTGTDITYNGDAAAVTAGSVFTINTDGVYAITYADGAGVAVHLGISINQSNLSLRIYEVPDNQCLLFGTSSSGSHHECLSWTGFLTAGTVLRCQIESSPSGYPGKPSFTIIRLL